MNGRCRKIEAVFPSGQSIMFDYMTACAEYLIANGYTNTSVDHVISSMFGAIKNNRTYRGVKLTLQ